MLKLSLNQRIQALENLGEILRTNRIGNYNQHPVISAAIVKAQDQNPWFTDESLQLCFSAWAESLSPQNIERWISAYPLLGSKTDVQKKIAVIMAGNIPMVGLHDLISVFLAGHQAQGKLSSKDEFLIPALIDLWSAAYPEVKQLIQFTQQVNDLPDGLIATGSDTTKQYFQHQFTAIPKLLRGNRHSIALLDGTETREEIDGICLDIQAYYGLGCRNISQVFVTDSHSLSRILDQIRRSSLNPPPSYLNNLKQQKALLIQNRIDFIDAKHLIFVEDQAISSPVGRVNYSFYQSRSALDPWIVAHADQIQCMVSKEVGSQYVSPGQSQYPALWEYADHIDTLNFLLNL